MLSTFAHFWRRLFRAEAQRPLGLPGEPGAWGLGRAKAHLAQLPENPLASVHDRFTARAFVRASFRPPQTEGNIRRERLYTLFVLHAAHTCRDRRARQPSQWHDLDALLTSADPGNLVALLYASPVAEVRREIRRMAQEIGREALWLTMAGVQERYGGRWTRCPDGQWETG
jgi:hypothetical protein